MSKLVFATFLVSLVVASTPWPLREQQFEYNKQAEVDAKGNLYVGSDQGKLIWMANKAQIQDESVPMSAVLTDERTKWIAKVLRQIGKIRPGMRRRDLLTVFTTEGGISTRTQRT